MPEAVFSINLEGELLNAEFNRIEDDSLKQKISDELLISQILDRANDPKHYNWNFRFGDIHIEILCKKSSRVDFFVSTVEPDILTLKRSSVGHNKKFNYH